MSVLPVTCFQVSATAFCTAIPPPRLTRSRLKSSRSKPGVCSSALKSVFTPLKNVKPCCASSRTKPAKSRGLAISRLQPPVFMKNSAWLSAKMWYSGSAPTIVPLPDPASSGANHASSCITFATMLRCVSTAPFDTPVVPPVYCRNAMSSCVSCTGARFSYRPLLIASANRIASGSEYSGTCLRTCRSTKFAIADFGKPSMSPAPVTITVSTSVAASTASSVCAKLSRMRIARAPESRSWCSTSRGV